MERNLNFFLFWGFFLFNMKTTLDMFTNQLSSPFKIAFLFRQPLIILLVRDKMKYNIAKHK